MNDAALQQFRYAMAARAIIPPAAIVADGKIHRADVSGPHGKDDAAYILFDDGIPAGGFENHKDGLDWQDWRANMPRELSPAEAEAYRKRIEAARREREAEDARRKAEAQKRAQALWKQSTPCSTDHPYLKRKGVQAHGARLHDGALVMPLRDTGGMLHSLQFIGADGTKRFLAGGRKAGCYYAIGKPDGVLCLAEGFATAASVHEATGYAAAVAFDCGNLLPVAKALREKFPDLCIVLCADDDAKTDGNPGLTKAREAARAIGGTVAIPDFGDDRPDGATDFNDLTQAKGSEAAKTCIDAALDAKDDEPRTCFAYGGGRFELRTNGVFFVGRNKDGEDIPDKWLCSPLKVQAKTRNAKGSDWGRLLAWQDDDAHPHQWPMPLELLQGDGSDVRRELSRQGLSISSGKGARDLLNTYLQIWPVEKRARCVDRLGWFDNVFVLPSETIGQTDEITVFQNAQNIEPSLAVCGTLEDWRKSVTALALGNTRLVFAISAAFAGALIEPAGEESGGFHLRGASSTGKTTALRAAASVWGKPSDYIRLWRATANGLEGLAALHNDGLLILDELSQVDPKEAGDAAYMLANGQGKARASRTGAARQSARWRLLFLSSGEEPLSGLMKRAGRTTNAGQEIRLADIEADAGAGHGAFEDLHGFASGAALAEAIGEAASRSYGIAGPAWLRHLVENRAGLKGFIANTIAQFVADAAPQGAAGQVQRVARRFGLVAASGEMANRYGLTGWPEGEAIKAAKACFAAWLEGYGGIGNREERAILDQVKAFFEAHGASRFENVDGGNDQRIVNRAGFYREDDGTRKYLVLPEAFKAELCKGFDPKTVVRVLRDAGWLEPGADGRNTQKPRIAGMGTPRCYVFNARLWEGEP